MLQLPQADDAGVRLPASVPLEAVLEVAHPARRAVHAVVNGPDVALAAPVAVVHWPCFFGLSTDELAFQTYLLPEFVLAIHAA